MENSTCMDTKTDNAPDGTSDEEDCEPDPRIQTELDKLNTASIEINQLENELDEARTKYRSIVSGTSGEMNVLAHDRKKSIQKAREYYKLTIEAKQAQSEALKSARQYQTAVGVYRAAKETVALAEGRLIEDTNTAATQLTSAWQEMLNHAISKVAEAEKEQAKSEHNHKRKSARYAELQDRIHFLEKKFNRSIKKARPYFEMKAELDIKLMQQKQNVSDIQIAIKCSKMKYTESLRMLEKISEEIHQSRREKFWSKVPRMPGVGADTDSKESGLSELELKSVGSEWSEYGEDDFDSDGLPDNEVFDINTMFGGDITGANINIESDITAHSNGDKELSNDILDVNKDRTKTITNEDTINTSEHTESGRSNVPMNEPGGYEPNKCKERLNTSGKDVSNTDSEINNGLITSTENDPVGTSERKCVSEESDKTVSEKNDKTERSKKKHLVSCDSGISTGDSSEPENTLETCVESITDLENGVGELRLSNEETSFDIKCVERPSLSGDEDGSSQTKSIAR